jgi:hypothetical protein
MSSIHQIRMPISQPRRLRARITPTDGNPFRGFGDLILGERGSKRLDEVGEIFDGLVVREKFKRFEGEVGRGDGTAWIRGCVCSMVFI